MSARARRVPSPVRGPLAAASLFLVAACSGGADTTMAPTEVSAVTETAAVTQAGGPRFKAGEVLVKFRAGASDAARQAALRVTNATALERIETAAMRQAGDDEGVQLVRTAMDVPGAVARLKGLPDVEYAEPNWIYTHAVTSNDLYYTNGSLWGMYGAGTTPANQFGSGASAAWARTADCSNVYVGIIDEGYYFGHEDLGANAAVNPGEGSTADGRDNDGNGLIDDIRGWDFDGNNNSVFDGPGDDHGTHVAGTIGAIGGNSRGVAGVCWSVKMLSAKFLGGQGGTTANAIKAVDYFTGLKQRGVPIVATNNSWGGGGFSQALQDAIERANQAGILFVAAAGNSTLNCETSACYPAEYPNDNIIAVASITNTGAISSFSNFGATTIDIGAPGSGIWSTVPGGTARRPTSSYASYNGTSMATPHVAGAVAYYKARNPNATAAQIKSAILAAATPTASLQGKVLTGGRLNISGF